MNIPVEKQGPKQIGYEWKISKTGPPWIVIDWKENSHEFKNKTDAMLFIARDQQMFSDASRTAMKDVNAQITEAFKGTHEQTAGTIGEDSEVAEGVGGAGNRRSKRGT